MRDSNPQDCEVMPVFETGALPFGQPSGVWSRQLNYWMIRYYSLGTPLLFSRLPICCRGWELNPHVGGS